MQTQTYRTSLAVIPTLALRPLLVGFAVGVLGLFITFGQQLHYFGYPLIAGLAAGLVRSVPPLLTQFRIDDEGVWVKSGLFPWQRKWHGYRWKEIEGAGSRQGPIDWLLGSSTITVNHRTKVGTFLRFDSVASGTRLVEAVNGNLTN
jgi:hypothetical protein